MLSVLVIGRIGKPGQTERIEYIRNILVSAGFEVRTMLQLGIYEDKDWRDDFEGAKAHQRKIEQFIAETDVDIVVADLSAASDGRTSEQILWKKKGVRVLGFAPVPISTPWRQAHVDEKPSQTPEELIARLKEIEAKNSLIDQSGFIQSPKSGVVTEIFVADWEEILAGQGLLVLTTNGIDQEIRSPISGRVRLLTTERRHVQYGEALIYILR